MSGGAWWLPFVTGWASAVLWLRRDAVGAWIEELFDGLVCDPEPEPVAPARPCVRLVWSRNEDGPWGGDAA